MGLGYHRVFLTLQINDRRLERPFKAGDMIMDDSCLRWVKANYPYSCIVVPMREQDWILYLSTELHNSYDKAMKLQVLCEQLGLDVDLPVAFDEKTSLLGKATIEGGMINPVIFKGGLKEFIFKARKYIMDIEKYEERIFSNFNVKTKTKTK